jgi:transcriptional regulator with XRE-family HTH domain
MEKVLENARQYILELKEAGKFSTKDIANISGVPLETVRNILSGKTAKNAGYETITKLILSLGGDLNVPIGFDKKKEIEANSTVVLKETSEMRIEDIIKTYEARIEDIKNFCEIRIADIQSAGELRIADMRKNYEERIEELKQLLFSINKL